ncbi:hypothetical protein [Streptomyces sp. NPDC094472]|uniref:hypothetical protein n=1 Tax=Streptomyces sp. NPDC094472 TaxID=3155080 RepID=UPI00333350F9
MSIAKECQDAAKGADWGTVPTLVSATVAILALAVAVAVFLRDRRLARRTDAEQVVCSVDDTTGMPHVSVEVHNTSKRQVHSVMAVAFTNGVYEDQELAERREDPLFRMLDVLRPDEKDTAIIPRLTSGQKPNVVGVVFLDLHNVRWMHDLRTHKVYAVGERVWRRELDRARAPLKLNTVVRLGMWWCRLRGPRREGWVSRRLKRSLYRPAWNRSGRFR